MAECKSAWAASWRHTGRRRSRTPAALTRQVVGLGHRSNLDRVRGAALSPGAEPELQIGVRRTIDGADGTSRRGRPWALGSPPGPRGGMVDTGDLKSPGASRAGSSPAAGTTGQDHGPLAVAARCPVGGEWEAKRRLAPLATLWNVETISLALALAAIGRCGLRHVSGRRVDRSKAATQAAHDLNPCRDTTVAAERVSGVNVRRRTEPASPRADRR